MNDLQINFELRQVLPMSKEESAIYRAARPAEAALIDSNMAKLRAELVAEFGEDIAEGLMPRALQGA